MAVHLAYTYHLKDYEIWSNIWLDIPFNELRTVDGLDNLVAKFVLSPENRKHLILMDEAFEWFGLQKFTTIPSRLIMLIPYLAASEEIDLIYTTQFPRGLHPGLIEKHRHTFFMLGETPVTDTVSAVDIDFAKKTVKRTFASFSKYFNKYKTLEVLTGGPWCSQVES